METQDIIDGAMKMIAAMEHQSCPESMLQPLIQMIGAVGSTEQPPDPWCGITGPPGFGPPSIPGMAPISWKDFATIAGEGAEPGPGWAYGTDTGGVTVTSRFTPPACPSAQPEIPVTAEMFDAGQSAMRCGAAYRDAADIYRAMAALAPTGDLLAEWNKLVRHDLIDRCAEKDLEIAALRTERDGWQKLYEDRVNRAQLLSFGVTSDTPEPPRRPDGTLVPQPKPWSPPKPTGNPARIGG